MGEVCGKTTVESLREIRCERVSTPSQRRTAVAVGITGNQLVELLTVGCGYILNIHHILESSLNLE